MTESKTDLTAPVRQRLTVDQAQIDPMTPVRPTAGPDVSTTVAGWSCQEGVPREATPMGDSASEHATESKVCEIDDEWSGDSSR